MLAVTRKSKIKDIVNEKKSVTVAELSKLFSVTEETIRRDLKALEEENFLTRTYGGAFIQDGVQNDISVSIRETIFIESKRKIAEKCASLIQNGDSIFIDPSTTAYFIAEMIADKRLTVLTNSLKVTNLLAKNKNIRLITIGGIYNETYDSFLGRSTLQALDNYFVDKSFISCRTLCKNHGITDSNEQLADLRQKIIERSNKTYLVADNSKFNRTSFISICNLGDITGIVTDQDLDDSWKELFLQNDTLLYTCNQLAPLEP